MGNKKLTPAQEAGFEVGDYGIAINRNSMLYSYNDLLKLEYDDNTCNPRWWLLSEKDTRYTHIDNVRKLTKEEIIKYVVLGLDPASEEE